jgi:hypothetical protein
MMLVNQPEVLMPAAPQHFDANGELKTYFFKQRISDHLAALVKLVKMSKN